MQNKKKIAFKSVFIINKIIIKQIIYISKLLSHTAKTDLSLIPYLYYRSLHNVSMPPTCMLSHVYHIFPI